MGRAVLFYRCIERFADSLHLEMHQYLDVDGSGSHVDCVSSTIGVERLTAATQWLTDHNMKGFLGEIGGGSNGKNFTTSS